MSDYMGEAAEHIGLEAGMRQSGSAITQETMRVIHFGNLRKLLNPMKHPFLNYKMRTVPTSWSGEE